MFLGFILLYAILFHVIDNFDLLKFFQEIFGKNWITQDVSFLSLAITVVLFVIGIVAYILMTVSNSNSSYPISSSSIQSSPKPLDTKLEDNLKLSDTNRPGNYQQQFNPNNYIDRNIGGTFRG